MSSPRVLYLGGFGRSGSTLLERSVGELADVCAVGELVHLWERGLLGNELCGCSKPFWDCPFWQEVGRLAFGGWDSFDVAEVLALKSAVDRNRHLPRLLLPWQVGRFAQQLQTYVAHYDAIYRAVAQVAGVELIVDSSKHASLAMCLRRASQSRVRIVHLIRDSPAVVYSWTKVVERPERPGDVMTRYSPWVAAAWWNVYNATFTLIAATGIPLRRVRYEDFVSEPLNTVRELARWAGSTSDPAAYLTDSAVRLSQNHSVAGNPMRFRTGEVAIRRDRAWQDALSPKVARRVRLWTFPFRAAYGYLRDVRSAEAVIRSADSTCETSSSR